MAAAANPTAANANTATTMMRPRGYYAALMRLLFAGLAADVALNAFAEWALPNVYVLAGLCVYGRPPVISYCRHIVRDT